MVGVHFLLCFSILALWFLGQVWFFFRTEDDPPFSKAQTSRLIEADRGEEARMHFPNICRGLSLGDHLMEGQHWHLAIPNGWCNHHPIDGGGVFTQVMMLFLFSPLGGRGVCLERGARDLR